MIAVIYDVTTLTIKTSGRCNSGDWDALPGAGEAVVYLPDEGDNAFDLPTKTQRLNATLDGYVDDLVLAKTLKRDEINAECQRRILARWPLTTQQSVALGVYVDNGQCATDVATLVAESNAATAAVLALTTIAAVEAYDAAVDPMWTDIGIYTHTLVP